MGEGSSARVGNDRVYVAVGKDVEQSKSTLLWALDNFDGDFRILHVHQPERIDPTGQCCHPHIPPSVVTLKHHEPAIFVL